MVVLMIPVIPHFASECIKILKQKNNIEEISWPSYDKKFLEDSECNIVIQINGKKRGLIKIAMDSKEEIILEKIKNNSIIKKHLEKNDIKKKIYIKNKLLNLII